MRQEVPFHFNVIGHHLNLYLNDPLERSVVGHLEVAYRLQRAGSVFYEVYLAECLRWAIPPVTLREWDRLKLPPNTPGLRSHKKKKKEPK